MCDVFMYDMGYSQREHQFYVVPHVPFCVACGSPAGHEPMGVYGVSGHFYCSMECHDSMECPQSAVVYVPEVVACMGMHASSMMVQCPSCAYRSEMARRQR